MKENVISDVKTQDDARLVQMGLGGDREAFGHLVARYQSPVCALAYSACGDIAQSEDLAQETFITAWRKLGDLKEPAKFRAWLFGITRNLIASAWRHKARNPLAAAGPLDEGLTTPATTVNPAGQAITKEEEQMMWRALEQIPETYREPLVLFYRENLSVERVAATLELSEEAVRQRLSRGRKLLQEQVAAFVEGALVRTNPGQTFTLAVVAALPAATNSVLATGAGAAGKAGLTAKGILMACLLPFLGVFTGFGAQWLMFQGGKHGPSKLRLIVTWIAVMTFAVGGQTIVESLGRYLKFREPVFFAAMAGFWWFYAMVMTTWITPMYARSVAASRAQQAAGATIRPEAKSMTTFTRATVVAGTHFMIFWGIILQAWQEHDRLGAAIITGLMIAAGIWNFFKYRNQPVGPAYILQLASGCGVVLVILNLRLDFWLACNYGVTVAQLHEQIPFWMVPALTLVLVLWTIFLLAATKPKGPGLSPVR